MADNRTSDAAAAPRETDAARRCPACLSNDLEVFLEYEQVPVHGVLLMYSREAGRAHPRADLQLAVCSACGFVTNVRFEAGQHEYGPDYEESQHCSSTFSRFAADLAQRLVDDFDLRDRSIVEIGCGKGEFLAELCRLGNNRGVGIDPSCRPERIDAAAAARIEFRPEFYSAQHAGLAADMICCRHTLEHIQPVHEFLALVRGNIKPGTQPVVFCEVPSLEIIVREARFWDLYYEHCSYFDRASLATLFERTGFEVLDVWLDYDEQYLCLTARPSGQAADKYPVSRPRAKANPSMAAPMADFAARCQASITLWREVVAGWHAQQLRPVLWGAGSKCVAFLAATGLDEEIEYVVDISPYKQDRFLPGTGHRVVAPDFLREYRPRRVLAMNSVYRQEIQAQLDALGLEAELHAL
ncbi:MAG: methyltransferase domain-containing protein [Planctomycetota bacterium]|nr:MAG: methyltransferase domain-containing protein [Planctomycetota bacterium]REK24896.1 MAG: methyltransferase domain-containing protein [Planctomycetota bacterium]REK48763.1 MAG: methyltransferase domain-containing protein [Planctomycetota bacterium]